MLWKLEDLIANDNLYPEGEDPLRYKFAEVYNLDRRSLLTLALDREKAACEGEESRYENIHVRYWNKSQTANWLHDHAPKDWFKEFILQKAGIRGPALLRCSPPAALEEMVDKCIKAGRNPPTSPPAQIGMRIVNLNVRKVTLFPDTSLSSWGIEFDFEAAADHRRWEIAEVLPGGQAAVNDLRPGDTIFAVNGLSTTDDQSIGRCYDLLLRRVGITMEVYRQTKEALREPEFEEFEIGAKVDAFLPLRSAPGLAYFEACTVRARYAQKWDYIIHCPEVGQLGVSHGQLRLHQP